MSIEHAKNRHVAFLVGWLQGAHPSLCKNLCWTGEPGLKSDFERGAEEGTAAFEKAKMAEFERLSKELP